MVRSLIVVWFLWFGMMQQPVDLTAQWQAGQLQVAWSSPVPACLAVVNVGRAHVLPETCQASSWTLAPTGVDVAYALRQDTELRLIANDGLPRVLAAQAVPLQPRRWLPVVRR